MVTPERVAEYRRVVDSVRQWAREETNVIGVAVVGSWARQTPRMDSDVDLVILTSDTDHYVRDADGWIAAAVGEEGEVVRVQCWGPLTEMRVAVASGLHV